MPRRLWIHLGGDPPKASLKVDDMLQAMHAIKGPGANDQAIELAHDLLAPPVLVAPLFHHIVDGVAFASNCVAAYLLAQVDEAFLQITAKHHVIVPRFSGSLAEIQQAIVAWTVGQTSPGVLTRVEEAARKALLERHRRLALLRGHLTAMRWASGDNEHLAAIEAQVSRLIARETRAWI